MAVADSSICNQALAYIGQKEFISSLTDGSANALICNVIYGQTRDALLCAFDWPFAEKHAVLANLSTTRTEWAYAYVLPGDFLKARYISTGVRPGALGATVSAVVDPQVADFSMSLPVVSLGRKTAYAIEASDDNGSRILLTDQAAAELVYTAAIATPSIFPPLFTEALAFALAAKLALALPVKPALGAQLAQTAQAVLMRAISEQFRGEQEDPQPDSEFIAVRG